MLIGAYWCLWVPFPNSREISTPWPWCRLIPLHHEHGVDTFFCAMTMVYLETKKCHNSMQNCLCSMIPRARTVPLFSRRKNMFKWWVLTISMLFDTYEYLWKILTIVTTLVIIFDDLFELFGRFWRHFDDCDDSCDYVWRLLWATSASQCFLVHVREISATRSWCRSMFLLRKHGVSSNRKWPYSTHKCLISMISRSKNFHAHSDPQVQ